MTSVERRNLFKRAVIVTLIAFAFGLVFSLLMGVGIPLILEASGAKKLASPPRPPEPPMFPRFPPIKAPVFVPR